MRVGRYCITQPRKVSIRFFTRAHFSSGGGLYFNLSRHWHKLVKSQVRTRYLIFKCLTKDCTVNHSCFDPSSQADNRTREFGLANPLKPLASTVSGIPSSKNKH